MENIKQIVQEALDGGWVPYNDTRYVTEVMMYDEQNDIFMDPKFWKAVARSRSWENTEEEWHLKPMWLRKWHKFIDYIADGENKEVALSKL